MRTVILKSFGMFRPCVDMPALMCFYGHRYESYLSHSDPVVLALNPFFVLEYVLFSA